MFGLSGFLRLFWPFSLCLEDLLKENILEDKDFNYDDPLGTYLLSGCSLAATAHRTC